MEIKKNLSLLIIFILLIINAYYFKVVSFNNNSQQHYFLNNIVRNNSPILDSGSIIDQPEYNFYKRLYFKNGRIINFYIKNKSTQPIIISIGSNFDRIIEPKESGYISTDTPEGFFGKSFKFHAEGIYGGNINFDYTIAQRDRR